MIYKSFHGDCTLKEPFLANEDLVYVYIHNKNIYDFCRPCNNKSLKLTPILFYFSVQNVKSGINIWTV